MYQQFSRNASITHQQYLGFQHKPGCKGGNCSCRNQITAKSSKGDQPHVLRRRNSPSKSSPGLFQQQRRHIGMGLAGCLCAGCQPMQQLFGSKPTNLMRPEPAQPMNLFRPAPAFADTKNDKPNAGNLCFSGTKQSPVALPTLAFKQQKDKIALSQKKCNIKKVVTPKNGSMQVQFDDCQITKLGSRELVLLQYHFHTPSEHSFGGQFYPMEAHLVHQDAKTGGFVVIGVMMKRGDANPALQFCLNNAQPSDSEQSGSQAPYDIVQADPKSLMPEDLYSYARYFGSLTTPPCSEPIEWILLEDCVEVGDKQIIDFEYFLGNGITFKQNARPLQRDQNEVEFLYNYTLKY